MKLLFRILFILLSLSAQAQTQPGFPVLINNSVRTTPIRKTENERLDYESMGTGAMARAYALSYTGTNLSLATSTYVSPGRALVIDNLSYSANQIVDFQLNLFAGGTTSLPYNQPGAFYATASPGGASIPLRINLNQNMAGFGGTATKVTPLGSMSYTPGSTIAATLNVTAVGRIVTDDFNTTADYIINVIGDSNSDGYNLGTANPNTPTLDMWAFMLRNYYIKKGYNVRLRNWSVYGSTMIQHNNRAPFKYLYNEPGQTHIVLGTNDANLNAGAILLQSQIDQSKAALYSLLEFRLGAAGKQMHYVWGIIPNGSSANLEANAATLSTAYQATVTQFVTDYPQFSAYVKFMPGTRTAYVANTTNLQADLVHLTAAGNTAVFQTIKTALEVTGNNGFLFN